MLKPLVMSGLTYSITWPLHMTSLAHHRRTHPCSYKSVDTAQTSLVMKKQISRCTCLLNLAQIVDCFIFCPGFLSQRRGSPGSPQTAADNEIEVTACLPFYTMNFLQLLFTLLFQPGVHTFLLHFRILWLFLPVQMSQMVSHSFFAWNYFPYYIFQSGGVSCRVRMNLSFPVVCIPRSSVQESVRSIISLLWVGTQRIIPPNGKLHST